MKSGVFTWLLETSFDSQNNGVKYSKVAEYIFFGDLSEFKNNKNKLIQRPFASFLKNNSRKTLLKSFGLISE